MITRYAHAILLTYPQPSRSIASNQSQRDDDSLQLVPSTEWHGVPKPDVVGIALVCHEFDLGSNPRWGSRFVLDFRKCFESL